MAQVGIFFGSTTKMTDIAGDVIKNKMEYYGHLVNLYDVKTMGLTFHQITKIWHLLREWFFLAKTMQCRDNWINYQSIIVLGLTYQKFLLK